MCSFKSRNEQPLFKSALQGLGEMEFTMFKKYVLVVVLGLLAVLALSAFSSVNYQPVTTLALSIEPTGSLAPRLSNLVVSTGESNFRIAHTWNGIFIPSMDVTGLLTVPSSAESNFRIAHFWDGIFIPSMDVTGLL
jgi:hypothetical protein